MKKTVLTKFTITALLTISACLVFSDPGRLSVNGSATIFVEPDIITLDLYTAHSAESANRVNQEISNTMKKMLEIARAARILEKDLSTSGVTITAYRQQNNNCSNLNHQARQSLRLVIRDLNQTVSLIDQMVSAGALVQNVQPGVSNLEEKQDKALEMAIDNARQQASTAASRLGLKVGKAVEVNFSSGRIQSDSSSLAINLASVEQRAPVARTYVPGKIPVHQSIQVVFESDEQ